MLIDDIAGSELYYPMRNWVSFRRSGDRIGIGYPRFSPSCREHQSRTGGIYTPPPSEIDEEEAEILDAIILKLPGDLLVIIKIYYLMSGNAKAKVAAAGVSQDTFYRRLRSARQEIYTAFVSQPKR